MHKTLVTGDSHSSLFSGGGLVHSPGAMTMRSVSTQESYFSQFLTRFLTEHSSPGDSLILCVGEIDIRAHAWRDIPPLLARLGSIEAYFDRLITLVLSVADNYISKFRLHRVIFWGPPPSSMNGSIYHESFPFVGDVITRNILTHIFIQRFLGLLSKRSSDQRVRFCSLYYSLIDFDFISRQDIFYDGLHLDHDLFGSLAWQHCSDAASSARPVVMDSLSPSFKNFDYILCTAEKNNSKNSSAKFDSWTLVESPVKDKMSIYLEIDLNSRHFFSFLRSDEASETSHRYLCLKKIRRV